VFDISAREINGILRFRVEDASGDCIWDMRLPGEKYKQIEFGVVPEGTEVKTSQTFPADSKVPATIRGMRVKVVIEYQYDACAPCSDTFRKLVEIP
jgi:hypothetical protein